MRILVGPMLGIIYSPLLLTQYKMPCIARDFPISNSKLKGLQNLVKMHILVLGASGIHDSIIRFYAEFLTWM